MIPSLARSARTFNPNRPINFGTVRRTAIRHASKSELAEINGKVDEFFQKERERNA